MGLRQPVGGSVPERIPWGFSDEVEFNPPKKHRDNVNVSLERILRVPSDLVEFYPPETKGMTRIRWLTAEKSLFGNPTNQFF